MAYDANNPDKLAESEEDIWSECAARLAIATEAESDNRIRGVDALKFRWGDQWPDIARNDRKADNRPCLTVNHTDVACTRLENQLRQQRPRIKVHPTKDATIDKARRINGLIRHIETRSNASVAYDWGVEKAKDIGWGYWRVISEYLSGESFDQELKILGIRNPFTVYMDPSSIMPAGEDSNWVIISETMPRTEYKLKYPRAENSEYKYIEAPGDYVLDWESKTHVRLAEYFRIYEKNDTLLRLSDGSVQLESEFKQKFSKDSGVAISDVLSALQLTVEAHRPTTRRQVQWFRLNGREVVDKRALRGKYIPVIRCEGNVLDMNGKVLRKGMIENLKDPAQMYNYWNTAFTERLALTPKAPWVVAEGQTEGHPEWNDANRRSYSTLVYKPVTAPGGGVLPPPERQAPAQIEGGFAEAMDRAERDLMTVSGLQPEDPQTRQRIMSGDKYLQRRQGMQDLTHFQYYDNQTYSIMWTGIILLDLIPHYYDAQRQQRIIGEDGKPEMVNINDGQPDNDMTAGEYDVVMDTGPGYATKREEAADSMLRLMDTNLGEVVATKGADIAFRNMDFDGAEELADRVAVSIPGAADKIIEGLPKQAQTIIGALQAQLQQQGEEMQKLQLEIKYKSGIESMKDQGQTTRTQIQAQTQLQTTGMKVGADDANSQRDMAGWMLDTQVNRETALDVEEMKGATARDVAEIRVAGQLMNTHAEAKHNEKAADKALKAGETDRKPA